MKIKSILIGVAAVGLITGSLGVASIANATADKTNICHQTESEQNPWNAIEVSGEALEAHEAHAADYPYAGPEEELSDEWCEENVPEEEPTPSVSPSPTPEPSPEVSPSPSPTPEATPTPEPSRTAQNEDQPLTLPSVGGSGRMR